MSCAKCKKRAPCLQSFLLNLYYCKVNTIPEVFNESNEISFTFKIVERQNLIFWYNYHVNIIIVTFAP